MVHGGISSVDMMETMSCLSQASLYKGYHKRSILQKEMEITCSKGLLDA